MRIAKGFCILSVFLLSLLVFSGCVMESVYPIRFESNGGTDVATQNVMGGSMATRPVTEREGYRLEGWYTSDDEGISLNEKWSFSTSVVRRALTLYAKWVPNAYDITFDGQGADGGDELDPMVVTYGQTYKTLPFPTRTGHTFLGWSRDTDEEILVSEDSEIDAASDHTLFAIWQINCYTITFNSNEGSSVDSITADYGTQITEPIPNRLGYAFEGWYEDAELTESFDFGTMPAEDLTIYAKWQIIDYGISYEMDGGNNHFGNPSNYRITTPTIELWQPNKEGHTFLDWYADEEMMEKVVSIDIGSTGDRVLYAKWRINSYTITFDANEGSAVEPITQNYGTKVMEPTTPERLGYVFEGWFVDEVLTTSHIFETMPAENMTLYAKWQINSYTITFDVNEGSSVSSVTQDYDTIIVEPDQPVREGYTFMGWYASEEFLELYAFDRIPAENMTLYALWHNTIIFESNGGSFIEPITMCSGQEIEEPQVPTKEGHTFIAWFTDQGFTEEFVFSTMPEPNITLYAKWDVNEYSVTFVTNGGTAIETVVREYGSNLADHVSTRSGYVFWGWHLESTLSNRVDFLPAMDLTVYAKWLIEFDMVSVGNSDTTYTVPTNMNDDGRTDVEGGYLMATTETTYQLWYEVCVWAESNSYHFGNPGREGMYGTIGAEPTDNSSEPVTYISLRDVIVWMNAISEMVGLHPVYRTAGGSIIRNSEIFFVGSAARTNNNGYRLPTSDEWEMAARWRNSEGDGSILVGGRYWTPGSYVSGGAGKAINSVDITPYAWYRENSGYLVKPVAGKISNHLGIHDMSGNVSEWTFTVNDQNDWIYRGGSAESGPFDLAVGSEKSTLQNTWSRYWGFRSVRTP